MTDIQDDESSTGKKGTGKKKAEYERIRQSGRERLTQLAQPKVPRIEKWTSVGPHLMWGTQETLWPIKSSTLNAEPTERLIALATPKKNFQEGKENRPLFYYSCGRTSVICNVGKGAKSAEATERLTLLAQAKDPHKNFQPDRISFETSCGRSSPIWKVSKAALTVKERSRTEILAEPKQPHRDWRQDRQTRTAISPYVLSRQPTDRIIHLSTPRPVPEAPYRAPTWIVSDGAKTATASQRSIELSRPRGMPDGFVLPKDVEADIPRTALRYKASKRLKELSEPRIRETTDFLHFDPEAFKVKPFALEGAFPATRTERLARPRVTNV